MATVYKIEIKTVSPWVSYTEETVQKMFEEFLETYRDEKTGNRFESTKVKVERK